MKTGFGLPSDTNDQLAKTIMDIITPVFEESMILACDYAKACGRNTVIPEDIEYAMKFCAMHRVGQNIGSILPEIYDEEDDEEDDIEITDEDIPFERYSGDDPKFLKINEAYDAWDSWEPTNPSEQLIKNAIDSNGHEFAGGLGGE